MSRDNGETIFALRHQDVSQGPLGWYFEFPWSFLTRKIPWCFECFQLFFSVFPGFFSAVERGKKSLVFWEVFLGFYLNTKEWKIRVHRCNFQKNSRRLWRSRRRKSSSVPEGAANFPAAVFLAGECPNLGRDSISCCRKIGEEFSSSVEICPKTFPARNFGQPRPSRVF